jgi:hypothetical protein
LRYTKPRKKKVKVDAATSKTPKVKQKYIPEAQERVSPFTTT